MLALSLLLCLVLVMRPVWAFVVMSHDHAHCDHGMSAPITVHVHGALSHDARFHRVASQSLAGGAGHDQDGDQSDGATHHASKLKCCGTLCASVLPALAVDVTPAALFPEFRRAANSSPIRGNRIESLFRPPRGTLSV
jgi:hypothetical protein